MIVRQHFCLLIVILHCTVPGASFEPVSGFYAGLAAVGSIAYTSFDAIRCKFMVCCNSRWVTNNIAGLEKDLSKKLHGQHLVQKTVLGHIKGHLRNENPSKALVLSFHGLTGVGKNFVSRIIADNLYKEGLRSKYVHLISATKEFPHEGMIPFYKDQLQSWIVGNVTRCERSMFIFDEVDKLPSLLLDTVKPYLDFYEHLGGINYRNSIFLFLSNAGGTEIGKIMLQHWQDGKTRESLQLSEIEDSIMLAAINADNHNGLWHSQLISNHLITAFIPFLPLDKEHVRKCIKDALITKKYFSSPDKISEDIVNSVIKELKFWPAAEQVFSTTGCKRVAEKIDYVMLDKKIPVYSESRKEL